MSVTVLQTKTNNCFLAIQPLLVSLIYLNSSQLQLYVMLKNIIVFEIWSHCDFCFVIKQCIESISVLC